MNSMMKDSKNIAKNKSLRDSNYNYNSNNSFGALSRGSISNPDLRHSRQSSASKLPLK